MECGECEETYRYNLYGKQFEDTRIHVNFPLDLYLHVCEDRFRRILR